MSTKDITNQDLPKVSELDITNEKLFTAQELADLLKISRQTVYNLFENGKIPHINLGERTKLVPETLLMHALEKCTIYS